MRFRRTIKIAPGLRLNVGKRGVSVSAGVRGARVTLGKGRVTRTVGLPGTGLSWSETTRTTGGGVGRAGTRAEQRAQMARIAAARLTTERDNYEAFLKIANASDPLRASYEFDGDLKPRDFQPALYGEEVLSRWQLIKVPLKYTSHWYLAVMFFFFFAALSEPSRQISVTIALLSLTAWMYQVPALLLYGVITSGKRQTDMNQRIASLNDAHPAAEAARIEQLTKLYNGDPASLEAATETALTDFSARLAELPHPFALSVSFDLRGRTLVLDTDLPEIENVVIKEHKKVLKSGEISVKAKKEAEINHEYAAGVVGIAFNLATRVLNVSPYLESVEIAGYTQRMDRTIGKVRDQYVYRVTFTRGTLAQLDLSEIDPLQSLDLFTHEIALDRSSHLSEVKVDAAV